MRKILILSDGKPGHENQSIAFAKLKGVEYDIVQLPKLSRLKKIVTYILDFLHLYIDIFGLKIDNKYVAIVSTGSSTYYATKVISKRLDVKSIAIMLPKGFRYSDFTHIIAQDHDNPPQLDNVTIIPVNLSVNTPKGYIEKEGNSKYVGLIVGGDNKLFKISYKQIEDVIKDIFKDYPEHKKLVTTSRRTPKDIEELCESYDFDYKLIYSKEPTINPIPDFIELCEELYITSDSTSMISEAVANSNANLHIVMLESSKTKSKYHKLIEKVSEYEKQINLNEYLENIKL